MITFHIYYLLRYSGMHFSINLEEYLIFVCITKTKHETKISEIKDIACVKAL